MGAYKERSLSESSTKRPIWEIIIGYALIVPALIFLVSSYAEPWVWGVGTSFRTSTSWLGVGDIRSSISNYSMAFDSGFTHAIRFSLSLLGFPFFAVVVLSPLLAFCAHRCGTLGRRVALICLTIPAAAFVPSAIAASWASKRPIGISESSAISMVRIAYGLTALSLICAVAVTSYLAIFRGVKEKPRKADGGIFSDIPWKTFGVTATVIILAMTAAVFQELTYPLFLSGGGPGRATATPVMTMFGSGDHYVTFGSSAAVSTMLSLLLACLGIGATVIIIMTGLRIEIGERKGESPEDIAGQEGIPTYRVRKKGSTRGAWVGEITLLAIILIGTFYALAPWLSALIEGKSAPRGGPSTIVILSNTYIPSFASTCIGVGAAVVAAYGIGVVQPLGDHSDWLLLPFAPFLFVGVGPAALREYAHGVTADGLDTMYGLIPPTRLAIPALFVFTLFAKGQSARLRAITPIGKHLTFYQMYIMPILPLFGIVFMMTWIASAQDLLWPLLSGSGHLSTGPVRLYEILGNGNPSRVVPVSLAMPIWLLVPCIALAVGAQLRYLDRIVLRTD